MNAPYAPHPHQRDGIELLLREPSVALFDRVGVGKSLQVVHAACRLFCAYDIDTLFVVAPASARSVWSDPDPVLGEVVKHMYHNVPFEIHEYGTRKPKLPKLTPGTLQVVVTNYEYIRRPDHLLDVVAWLGSRRVLTVFDESAAVKTHSAAQTKACRKISNYSRRRVILNGTPGDPGHVFTQFHVLDPNIVGYKNFFQFRSRHALMGGFRGKEILGWTRLDDFNGSVGPLILRRSMAPTHPPAYLTVTVTLTPETWKHYCSMRDTLIVELSSGDRSVAAQAGTKVMRLSQITSGFLGGFDEPFAREIGNEKLNAVIDWLEENPSTKAVIWQRFRSENDRTSRFLGMIDGGEHEIARLYGGVPDVERERAKMLFAPGGDPSPAYFVGHVRSAGSALNLAASSVAIYASQDYSSEARQQSEGRLNRPGQKGQIVFVDLVAEGPRSEPTIDRVIIQALRKKEQIENWTAETWRNVLIKEREQ